MHHSMRRFTNAAKKYRYVLNGKRGVFLGLGAGIGVGSTLAWYHLQSKNTFVRSNFLANNTQPTCVETDNKITAGQVKKGLPNYPLEEVSKHRTIETRIWVTYGDGVYDITDFEVLHPGGSEKLLLAAGKPLEPFWEMYGAHNSEHVHSMLEELRIGNISPSDRGKNKNAKRKGLFDNDPIRSSQLKPIGIHPFSAGTPAALVGSSFLTPNNIFYVRNHFPVPQVDPKDFALEISGEGINTVKFTLKELKEKFPQYTVTATIQCAGNRRQDLAKIKPLSRVFFDAYIGNAEWRGVRLRDVLLYAGLKESEEYTPLEHVHLEGMDYDVITGERYGASIPIHKAMDRRGDCILVYEMNGEELPRDHGYPLRAVVPGTVGARNVKWLSRIVVSREEHGGLWQQIYYKGFPPSVDWNNVDYSSAPAIQEMPVQSIIYSPEEGATLETNNGVVTVSGIAWSGGGRGVIRVDVSCDGGKTWKTADLLEGSNQTSGRAWAWTLWKINVQVPSKGEVELCCKAVDSSYNVQPDTSAPLWNMKGYLSNAWHRIPVNVK